MWNLLLLLILCCSCNALTEEEIKSKFIKEVMKCNQDASVDMKELALLQQFVTPTKMETKCLLACAYKSTNVMTQDGLYDIEHAYKVAEMLKNGDEKRVVSAKKMADLCGKVNDVEVKDGEKGCDRAALIFTCVIDNAKKFGFKL